MPSPASVSLATQLEALLPQTQCTKCGYPSCHDYAVAMAAGNASHNQCPPGGEQGIALLADALGLATIPLNPEHGTERERPVAVIEEAYCIGCTLCIQACPVDAIVGAAKQMHTVIPELCTGCDLCVAPCPVDCISMISVTPGKTGWSAWSEQQASQAKTAYDSRTVRLQREKYENEQRLAAKAAAKLQALEAEAAVTAEEQASKDRKKAIIAAAIERARLKKLEAEKGQGA
ncbi:electron transport complex subunit RsxB [Undibacterium crateris]|uniref:electron transport complex subunit RsxB n=1 Tax=Undibacterium crateris TaxID=2528175 RepID=UPI001389F14C|nr:electron transport complex subunit RsxB [Undibacterium crateris]NDI86029.1 electron transport complex subunit RsxB [Undibacterium crateris]